MLFYGKQPCPLRAALCGLWDPESKSGDLHRLWPAGLWGVLHWHQTLVATPRWDPPSRLAPLYPHLINLSAKPFDTQHNMVPVFFSVFPLFQYGPSISRLVSSPTRSAPRCLGTQAESARRPEKQKVFLKNPASCRISFDVDLCSKSCSNGVPQI